MIFGSPELYGAQVKMQMGLNALRGGVQRTLHGDAFREHDADGAMAVFGSLFCGHGV
jgi:hypothetical protein